jgi:hypothetical protein
MIVTPLVSHSFCEQEPILGIIAAENEKTDVAEHPKAFDHVGLLLNKPPGTTGLLFV